MTTTQIKHLRTLGYKNDSLYEIAAGQFGLYGIAFFGHKLKDRKAQKTARAKLNRVWKRILSN